MKFLSDLIERYKGYRKQKRKKRLTSSSRLRDLLTSRKFERRESCISVRPNAPTSPSEEQEENYEQSLNWHKQIVKRYGWKYPDDKEALETLKRSQSLDDQIIDEAVRLVAMESERSQSLDDQAIAQAKGLATTASERSQEPRFTPKNKL